MRLSSLPDRPPGLLRVAGGTWQSNGLYKYSQRLSWHFASNSFTRLLEAKRLAGVPLLDLTVSNPTEAFSDYPHASIRQAYAQLEDFHYRPDPLGEERARAAIADFYGQRGIAISSKRLVLTASTSEAYALLFKMLGDPEAEILAPSPSYPLFEYLAALESMRIVPYRLAYDGAWSIDLLSVRERITQRTRAIVLVNPNNPTGSFLKRAEADELIRIAGEHGLPIISDEVFFDYSFGNNADRVKTLIGAESLLSFSLDGLSKTAAMPQMKLGWMTINGPEDEVETARERLELLLDTYLSVSTPVQRAIAELLRAGAEFQAKIRARTAHNLSRLHSSLEHTPAHALHLEGGWSAIIQLPRTLPEETWVTRLINEHGVVVQPGYFFDMASEAYVVVNLITPPEEFEEGILRLRTLVSSA